MSTQLAVHQLERDRLPVVNDEIASEDNRYRLLQILGDGGYGTVFLSQNTQKGTCKPDYVYVVMTLLYKDLHKLRSELPDRKFSFSTALRLAIQTFNAIEELHSIGFISRDIKPGNFAPGHKATKQGKIIFMYDFGLARKYLDKDLSRRDDIESWFYMLIEITKGSLPWRLVTDRAQVYAAKQAAREGDGRKNFLCDTPPQYNSLLTWIDALVFEDTPPYSKFYNLLETIREESKIRMYEHWDWEEETSPITSISRTNSERN